MPKSYKTIGKDGAVVIQRDSDEYSADVSVRVAGSAFGRTLTTDEIGEMSAYCALIYFRRTGKVPLPPATPPFATARFDTSDKPAKRYFYHPESDSLMATDDGSDVGSDGLVEELDEVMYASIKARMTAASEPTPEGEAPQIDTSTCPHCLDECTGECL